MCIGVTEDKSNGGEEVTLAGAIAAYNDVVFRRERLDDSLILIAKRYTLVLSKVWVLQGRSTYLLKPWMIICLIYILLLEVYCSSRGGLRGRGLAHSESGSVRSITKLDLGGLSIHPKVRQRDASEGDAVDAPSLVTSVCIELLQCP